MPFIIHDWIGHSNLTCVSTAPVEVKEVIFSSDIAAHDLLTKLNHVRSWLNKKNHVKITLRSGRVKQTQPLVRALWKKKNIIYVDRYITQNVNKFLPSTFQSCLWKMTWNTIHIFLYLSFCVLTTGHSPGAHGATNRSNSRVRLQAQSHSWWQIRHVYPSSTFG